MRNKVTAQSLSHLSCPYKSFEYILYIKSYCDQVQMTLTIIMTDGKMYLIICWSWSDGIGSYLNMDCAWFSSKNYILVLYFFFLSHIFLKHASVLSFSCMIMCAMVFDAWAPNNQCENIHEGFDLWLACGSPRFARWIFVRQILTDNEHNQTVKWEVIWERVKSLQKVRKWCIVVHSISDRYIDIIEV